MSHKGFTIIELLAVIAVIGILAAILISAIGSIRENAKISQSTSNLRQMGTYVNLYSMANGGELPIDTFGTPRNWINALWDLAYPDRDLVWTPDSQGRVLPNTIFYSPLMETDKARAGAVVRSYGWNAHARGHFTRTAGAWPLQANVQYPGRSILVGDTTNSSTISATNNQVNFRNNGQAAFLFVDGHVELRNPDEVPNNSNHVFWGGTILVEAE
jgi:prepilin-type N-terminal cleavage/methylation domain-containing protein/prepilin-type processing-associated H-X9-DG protein